MTNDDADGGVHESIAANMRAAAMVAMQVGERLAKTWTDLAREAEQWSAAEAALLAARLEAERTAAIASLTVVDRPEWWDRASVEEVAGMVETATTWRDRDPAAARALTVIDRQVQDRYGLPAEALQQRARADQDRTEAIQAVATADFLDRAAAGHEVHADPPDAREGSPEVGLQQRQIEQVQSAVDSSASDVAREAGETAYDSAERRDAFAATLEGSAEADLIAGLVRADVNFAYPAQQAVAVRGGGTASRGRAGTVPDRPRQRPARTR